MRTMEERKKTGVPTNMLAAGQHIHVSSLPGRMKPSLSS